jgi:hypothetical protein
VNTLFWKIRVTRVQQKIFHREFSVLAKHFERSGAAGYGYSLTTLLTTYRSYTKLPTPCSLRGVSGGDPEGGARCGVLRRRLATVRLGREGPRPPGTKTWTRGARCNRSGSAEASAKAGDAGREARDRRAQNRHGGAPRGERPASWDARRLVSA